MTSPDRNQTVRILIADDHAALRAGVRAILSTNPNWIVCGEAENGKQAVDEAERLSPDLVVLDLTMPEMTGLEASRRIRLNAPDIKILILTMHEGSQFEAEALNAGADAMVKKADAAISLVKAVEGLVQHLAHNRVAHNRETRNQVSMSPAPILDLLT